MEHVQADVVQSQSAVIDAQNQTMALVHLDAIMKVEPIQTIDRVQEVLKDQAHLYEIAIKICKQPDLKEILQSGLRKVQQEMSELRYGRTHKDN